MRPLTLVFTHLISLNIGSLGLVYNPNDLFQVRIDQEWREQRQYASNRTEPIDLQSFGRELFPQIDALELLYTHDKPWDEDFQDMPGTLGQGDQFSSAVPIAGKASSQSQGHMVYLIIVSLVWALLGLIRCFGELDPFFVATLRLVSQPFFSSFRFGENARKDS